MQTVTSQNSPFDAETMLEVTMPANEAVKAFNSTLSDTVQACQKECTGFWHLRLNENFALTTRLMGCRTIPEVQQAYADYWRRTAEQYGHEYSQMYHLMHDVRPSDPARTSKH